MAKAQAAPEQTQAPEPTLDDVLKAAQDEGKTAYRISETAVRVDN